MLDDDTIGFGAKKPVRLFNQRLGVDYPGVFKASAKAAAAFAAGNALGAVNAAIDGVSAFRIKDDLPPPVLAWHLIRIALARAMAELTIEALKSLDQDPEDPAAMVARLDGALEEAEIWIDRDFFARPGEHGIVEVVRGPFSEWLACFGLNQPRVGSVARRLPTYFTFALHREWAADPSRHAPIEAELRKADTPFARADARERAWLKNAAYLRRLSQEPVFEKTFGLDQIHIDLRAYWVEKDQKSRDRRNPPAAMQVLDDERLGLEDGRRHVVHLKRHLRAWLDVTDQDDCIRVVCGGPGSGKTSFAKMFAAELAETTDFGVLYAPLHEFDFTGDFRTALHRYVVEDARILPHDPLGDEEARRLVVFFDGLDELAMEGKAGQEAAAEFCDHLDRRIGNVNRDRCRLKVILGGREVVVQANDRVFRRPGQVFHMLPYYVPKGNEARRRDMPCREDFNDPKHLLQIDDRNLWWTKYGEVTGHGYSELPEPLQHGAPDEISAQPLFNYLLALSFERKKLPFGEAFNQNRLYRDLLEAVWERRWGKRQLPDVEKLEFAEFEGILKEIGLAAWHAGTRGVSAATVAGLCAKAGLDRELRAFERGAEQGVLSLMAAFYFKQTRRTGERTFEFTHKTFGEYLAGCRLVDAVAEIERDRAERRERRRSWNEEAALADWIRLTGPAPIDTDLLDFLQRQVHLEKQKADAAQATSGTALVDRWRSTLADLFSHQLNVGLPMEQVKLTDNPELTRFREMTRQARNAEEALLAAHFCCASLVKVRSEIDWPNEWAARDLIFRLDQAMGWESICRDCFAWITFDHVVITRTSLADGNFEGASLVGVNLRLSMLDRAQFRYADLSFANFSGARWVEQAKSFDQVENLFCALLTVNKLND